MAFGNFSVALPVEVVASGGVLVRQVDVDGAALDDATTKYGVALPVVPVNNLGESESSATKFSNWIRVTLATTGIPVVRVTTAGAAISTELGDTPDPTLANLTLNTSSVPENSSVGTVVGAIQNKTTGSSLSLTDDAGGLFSLNGSNVEVAGALDYEAATSHNITVRETLAGASNTPKDNVIAITVTNVDEGSLDAPTLVQTSDTGANPLSWSTTYPGATIWDDVDTGTKVRMRYRVDAGAWTTETDQPLTNAAVVDGFAWPLFDADTFLSGELIEVQEQQAYFDAGVETMTSDWSLTLSDTMADLTPDAFSFTDQTDVTLSTLTESNAITVSGINGDSPITITGGEYAIDSGAGYGAYTSSAGTVANGDLVKVRHTSAATGGTATNTVLTIGGVSDTFTTTTVGSSVQFTPSTSFGSTTTGATTTKTISSVDFQDGHALIIIGVDGSNKTAVTVGGVACTKLYEHSAEMSFWRSNSALSAGNHDIVITAATNSNFDVMRGTITNSGTVATSGGQNWASVAGDVTTGSVTCPTDGLILAFAACDPAIGPPTVSSGTEVDQWLGGKDNVLASRDTTGAITFTGYAFQHEKGLVWIALNKA